mgnify:CR=1 FL=1|tara:strand:- start:98 stop:676 length:579 start_codon:yes stop_codon:yes gene_type:complete
MPELHTILFQGNKTVPDKTEIQVRVGNLPNTINISLRLPGQKVSTPLLGVPIKEGVAHLPVNLIFLSHAKEDAAEVEELSAKLLQEGIMTWFDEEQLLPGDDWKLEIDTAMASADFIAIFLSSRSCSKEGYFQVELRKAIERNQTMPEGKRFLLPILLDECTPPQSLQSVQWLKVGSKAWFNRLVKAVRSGS